MLQGVLDDAPDVVVVQAVLDALALPLAHDQARLAEVTQVVGECALLDAELFLQGAHMSWALAVQPSQHGQPDGMGHAREQVDRVFERDGGMGKGTSDDEVII